MIERRETDSRPVTGSKETGTLHRRGCAFSEVLLDSDLTSSTLESRSQGPVRGRSSEKD